MVRPSPLALALLAALPGCGGIARLDPPPWEEVAALPNGCAMPEIPDGLGYDQVLFKGCWDPGELGGTCPAYDSSEVASVIGAAVSTGGCDASSLGAVACSLPSDAGECCYAGVILVAYCVGGRPWVGDDGRARTADHGAVGALPELARAWLEDALVEHASIASFSRHALELLAVGAPAELVRGAQRAAMDEVVHARLAFEQASRHHAGAPREPGPLDVSAAPARGDLLAAARAAAREGCVNETLAAELARQAAERATDPEAKAALERIAADEAAHAALSWRFVAWAIEAGGDAVRTGIADELAAALPPRDARAERPAPSPTLAAHGRFTAEEKGWLEAQAREAVLRPLAQALLGA